MYEEKQRKLTLFCDGAAFSRLRQLLASDPSIANNETAISAKMLHETRAIIGDVHIIEIVGSDGAEQPHSYSQFYILWVIAIVIVGMLTMGFICSGIIVWLDRM